MSSRYAIGSLRLWLKGGQLQLVLETITFIPSEEMACLPITKGTAVSGYPL
jgi:hypothetical protein